MIEFEEIGAANGVNEHHPIFDRPALKLHAIAMAGDLQPDDAPAKRLVQHLGIGRVIAQVGDDQRIVVMATINVRQRARASAAIQTLRQLFQFGDSQ